MSISSCSIDALCDKLVPYVISALKDDVVTGPCQKWSMLDRVRIDFYTELIAASWSETLRWAYKENKEKEISLRDCLLPEVLGRAEQAWNKNMCRIQLSSEKIEDILRKFGLCEISGGFELPWGGYVVHDAEGYKLIESK